MLRLTKRVHAEIIGHVYDGLPDEACGLLGGDPRAGKATVFYPCENVAHSSRVYTVAPLDHLHAERDAEARGLEILGVMHSHTHSDAYPSPTDVREAPDPTWHYVIVSVRQDAPVLRSYGIVEGRVMEEAVALDPR